MQGEGGQDPHGADGARHDVSVTGGVRGVRWEGGGYSTKQQVSMDNMVHGLRSLLDIFRCKACKGKRTTKEKKVIEITIDKGCPSDYRKVFYGEVS